MQAVKDSAAFVNVQPSYKDLDAVGKTPILSMCAREMEKLFTSNVQQKPLLKIPVTIIETSSSHSNQMKAGGTLSTSVLDESPSTHWQSKGSKPHWIDFNIPPEYECTSIEVLSRHDGGSFSYYPNRVRVLFDSVAVKDFINFVFDSTSPDGQWFTLAHDISLHGKIRLVTNYIYYIK